jgi:hypothetical protein
LAGFLGIEIFDELYRALDVSEEGGDGFSFAIGGGPSLQGFFLGQDALSQMRWGVADRSLGSGG